jgi:hypothetical protein
VSSIEQTFATILEFPVDETGNQARVGNVGHRYQYLSILPQHRRQLTEQPCGLAKVLKNICDYNYVVVGQREKGRNLGLLEIADHEGATPSTRVFSHFCIAFHRVDNTFKSLAKVSREVSRRRPKFENGRACRNPFGKSRKRVVPTRHHLSAVEVVCVHVVYDEFTSPPELPDPRLSGTSVYGPSAA